MAPPTKTSAMLVSGEYFDYLAPDPSVITLDVLEHGLDVPRFNNQTIRKITVLEHSLRVRRIVRELISDERDAHRAHFEAKEPIVTDAMALTSEEFAKYVPVDDVQSGYVAPYQAELWALLHDAHEALVPWGDCLRPGKTDEMIAVEAIVDTVIRGKFLRRIPWQADERTWSVVHTADAIALYFEAMLWMPGAFDWAYDMVNWLDVCDRGACCATPAIERFMPLIAPRPGECWRTEVEALIGKHRAA